MESETREGMGSSKSDDWGTPEKILQPIREHMGGIALDPCANVCRLVGQKNIHLPQDGLAVSWLDEVQAPDPLDLYAVSTPVRAIQQGVIFVNPPYGRAVKDWVRKCIAEANEGAEIVLLTAARVDTRWFHEIFDNADAVCFIKGRLKFVDLNTGETGDPAFFPSALAYWGPHVYRFQAAFEDMGHIVVPVWNSLHKTPQEAKAS